VIEAKRVALVAKATDIAKKIAQPPQGTVEGAIFGKIFEQLYILKNHVTSRGLGTPRDLDPFILRIFTYDLKSMLELHNIYSEELLRKGVKMYIALHRAGVTGIGVKPTFRKYEDDVYIAAQPDLYNPYSDEYFEFKTYPIDAYARMQAKIFAWVLQHPIKLVGLRGATDGYDVETILVEPKPLNIDPEIIKSVAREQPVDPSRYIPPHMALRKDEERSRRETVSVAIE
jgi:hypothetical protein